MNLKYIIGLSSVVLSLLSFSACQDDPVFPDPGFELEDQDVAVRRDTADIYRVSMEMDVPNGVDYIEVLNATNYELVETVDLYDGQKNFIFNYDIDLTAFENDTVLYYIFKVMDNDSRSTNRGFTLSVKGFSFPEIKLVGGTSLNVVVPVYQLQGIVSTGLNELASVQVNYKGEEQFLYEPAADTAIYEYILSEVIGFGTLVQGEAYDMDILIKDRKGQSSTTTITVRKSDGLKLPVKVNLYNYAGINSYLEFEYDDNNRVVNIDYTWETGSFRTYHLSYNDLGVVDTMRLVNANSDESGYNHYSMIYNYKENTTQLDHIVKREIIYYNNGTVEIKTDDEVESYDFQYNEDGVLTSFVGKSQTIYMDFADPFGTGESVFFEYWANYNYYAINDKYRQHRTGFQPIYMPTYIDGLPPFFTLYRTDIKLFCTLLYNKYIFTGTEASSDDYSGTGLEEPNFTYETDADGNLLSLTENFIKFGWQTNTNVYTFSY